MLTTPVREIAHAPLSSLERQLIDDYLLRKGYTRQELLLLPAEQARRIMTAACMAASLKLAEIEARTQFRHKIRYEEK